MSTVDRRRLIVVLLASVLVGGCDRSAGGAPDAGAGGAAAAVVPACAPAPAPPPSSARPDRREPRLTSLSSRSASMVDVAPGQPADADHPAGTVYVATVLDNGKGRGAATLFEWDVASARPLRPEGRLLYRESDKEENGTSADVRIATTHDDAFVAVTLEHGRFTVLGRSPLALASGNPYHDGEGFPPARNLSLETDGRWLAVAYERTTTSAGEPELPPTGIALYEAKAMKRVASIAFAQSPERGVRHDNLEMLNGRLYAAEPAGSKMRIVELATPSLQIVRKTEVAAPGPSTRVQLTSVRGHLLALSNAVLVELTPELEVVGKREVHASEVAVGPAGELLTPVGLEAPGGRGDFVPDARASASCTPAWAGGYPLLACTVDLYGVRIARLAPRSR